MSTWTEPKFDKHAFAGKGTKAVSATKTPEGWDTTGISFADFSTMHIQRREKVKERRLPRPDWASDNDVIASVVLNAAERRLYLPHDGPNDQRRARIIAESERRLPSMRAKLHRAVLRHHEAAKAGASPERLERFAIQVGGADTEVVMLERGLVGILVAVLYLYYNLGYSSIGVAHELGLKSPAVRMLLYTLHRAYARVQAGSDLGNRHVDPQSKHISDWPSEKVRLMFLLRASGKGWAQIGKIVKSCPNSVMNHWKKYFGDLRIARTKRVVVSQARLKKRHVYKEMAAKAIELRQTGMTMQEIADQLKVSFWFVQRALKGMPRPKVERPPRKRVPRHHHVVYYVKRDSYSAERVAQGKTCWTPDKLEKLAELWNSGTGVNECAKVLGAPVHGVNYALRRILKRMN